MIPAPFVYIDRIVFRSFEKWARKSDSLLDYDIEPKNRYGFAKVFMKSSLTSEFQGEIYLEFRKFLLKNDKMKSP